MSEDSDVLRVRELNDGLSDLGRHLRYPATPDLTQSVSARVTAHDVIHRSTVRRSGRRRLGLSAVAIVMVAVVLGSTLPVVRAAVSEWLALPGIQIVLGLQTNPHTLGDTLAVGRSTTMEAAQAALPFRILVPADLGRPDAVYLTTHPRDGVSLVYRPRPDLPATSAGVGCLITEFKATANQVWFSKMVGWQPLALRLPVGAYHGYWVRGSHVVFGYWNPRGGFVDHPRLAGNTLLWERKGLTLRLESALEKAPTIHIADSFH